MKLPQLINLVPQLRRLTPVGILVVFFSLPFLLLADRDAPSVPSIGASPAEPVSGPRVEIDPFAQGGAFAIRQADADRASWNWTRAKNLAADVWQSPEAGRSDFNGFYCGCSIDRRGSSGGDVDLSSCGYVPRASEGRASRLEWEHVVPAAILGRGRSCWSQGAPQCVDKGGRSFKGRECCMISDPEFIMAATDPVNLVPSIGEVNGDRLDYMFGMLPGQSSSYGQCDMKIDRTQRLVEPPAARRGDIARIWAYMSRAYGLVLPSETAGLYHQWILSDPVSDVEIRVNRAIERAGHRPNPFVLSGSN